MVDLIAIPIMAILDRLRGSGRFEGFIRVLFKAGMGAVAAYLLYDHDNLPLNLIVITGFGLGISIAYGSPWGSALMGIPMREDDLEDWQKGKLLETNENVALIYRGFLTVVPIFALLIAYNFYAYFASEVMLWNHGLLQLTLACMIAFVTAPNASHLLLRWNTKYDPWAIAELIRGGLIAALMLV